MTVDDGVPDTPLGRAYTTVATVAEEWGAMHNQQVADGVAHDPDIGIERITPLLERYGVDRDDFGGYATSQIEVLKEQNSRDGLVSGMLMAMMVGIELERQRTRP